jgi:hypothetical protein
MPVWLYIKWDATRNEQYFQILQSQQDIPLKRMNNLSRKANVHNSVSELTRTIYDSAFKVFGHSLLTRDDITVQIPQNGWFDDKCTNALRNSIMQEAFFHDTRLRQIYTFVLQLETITIKWRDRNNLTIKEEKDLNLVILLKRNLKKYVRQVLFHMNLLRYIRD